MKYAVGVASSARPTADSPNLAMMSALVAEYRELRSLGYDVMYGNVGNGSDVAEPHAGLARLAASDAGMALGLLYLAPLEQPVRVARELAALDAVCPSGVTVAFAAGWRARHFDAYGVAKAERGQRLTESLAIVRSLLREGTVSFHGTYLDAEVPVGSFPVGDGPGPLFLRGATADATLLAVPGAVDGWLASATASNATLLRQARLLRAAASATGHAVTIWALRRVYCARGAADEVAAAELALASVRRSMAERGSTGRKDLADAHEWSASDTDVRDRMIIGTATACREQLDELADAGIDVLVPVLDWAKPLVPDVQRALGERLLCR